MNMHCFVLGQSQALHDLVFTPNLQCFDAQLYLQMNERKPKWICPVCNKPALVENLLIDGFFMELIK